MDVKNVEWTSLYDKISIENNSLKYQVMSIKIIPI